MFRFLIFCLILFLVDYYAFQSIKTLWNSNWTKGIYIFLSVITLSLLLYVYTVGRQTVSIKASNLIVGLFILTYITKLVIALVLFGEDIVRFINGTITYFKTNSSNDSSFHLPSRRMFMSQLALGIAAIPFASLLYGIVKGKYNFKVLEYTLYFEDLPDAFDGYQLTQISDIHSGSFDNKEKIEYAIDLINKQQSDVILFTGDMVNLKTSEMLPWKDTFAKLKAKDGLYSVLGNHDYGDYVQWNTKEEKLQNLEDLKSIQKEIGFDLLLNESRFIKKGNNQIAIVGVENWGNGFRQSGDLTKASTNIAADDFKILLSHDPSHWQEKVINDQYHYHLTLSGHTHGMQMGIEIPGWLKWSPVKWRYKYWAGIYKEQDQYINVNRGFGFLAFPGRIGMWPEITVIKLKKGSQPV